MKLAKLLQEEEKEDHGKLMQKAEKMYFSGDSLEIQK